jgi:hypothetical protein
MIELSRVHFRTSILQSFKLTLFSICSKYNCNFELDFSWDSI